MKNLKKQVKADFVDKTGQQLSFDTSALSPSPTIKKRQARKVLLVTSCLASLLVVLALPILIGMFDVDDSFKMTKRTFTKNELHLIESSSFKALNEVEYPSLEREELALDPEYVEAVKQFTTTVYQNLDANIPNVNFAPFNLYSLLEIINLMSGNNARARAEFDNLLGLTEEKRHENYQKALRNNFFATDDSTVQIYNSVFYANKYTPNPAIVDQLASYYTEAFQMDFLNSQDLKKLLDWIDQRMKMKDFLDPESLEITEDTVLIYLSTLYFKERWANLYSSKYTLKDTFYGHENNIMVDYMNHTYSGVIYDEGSYVSVYDRYCDNYQIKYIVPKSLDDDIYQLTENIDILKDYGEKKSNVIIDLTVPKFDIKTEIDLSECLKRCGLQVVFDEYSFSLNDAFVNLPPELSTYLKYVKQKNNVSFNEDGTEIRSLTFAAGDNMATSTEPLDDYKVKLNQPFIYVIYDQSNLPIFVGHIDDPSIN